MVNKMKKTIGHSRKGELNSNYGNKWTDKQKLNASIRQKTQYDISGENNPSKNINVRKKISESKLGIKNINSCIWKLISPDNKEIIVEGGIKRKLLEYNLTYQKMRWKIEDMKYYSKNGWIMHKITI